jgi:hypothetical protein
MERVFVSRASDPHGFTLARQRAKRAYILAVDIDLFAVHRLTEERWEILTPNPDPFGPSIRRLDVIMAVRRGRSTRRARLPAPTNVVPFPRRHPGGARRP